MRLLIYGISLLGTICGGCIKVQDSSSPVLPAHNQGDEALRAFFDLRSTGKTLTKIDHDVNYVHAIARLEKGKLVGMDHVSSDIILAGAAEANFEILWGRKNDQYGYSFVSNETRYSFEPEPFYKHLVSGGKGWCVLESVQRTIEFRGMKVLAFAVSSYPKDPDELIKPTPHTKIEDVLKEVDYAALILFKECGSPKESIDLMRELR